MVNIIMKKHIIVPAIFIIYFIFAILMNSVGIVILQVQTTFGVTASDASLLEGFKDLPLDSIFLSCFLHIKPGL